MPLEDRAAVFYGGAGSFGMRMTRRSPRIAEIAARAVRGSRRGAVNC